MEPNSATYAAVADTNSDPMTDLCCLDKCQESSNLGSLLKESFHTKSYHVVVGMTAPFESWHHVALRLLARLGPSHLQLGSAPCFCSRTPPCALRSSVAVLLAWAALNSGCGWLRSLSGYRSSRYWTSPGCSQESQRLGLDDRETYASAVSAPGKGFVDEGGWVPTQSVTSSGTLLACLFNGSLGSCQIGVPSDMLADGISTAAICFPIFSRRILMFSGASVFVETFLVSTSWSLVGNGAIDMEQL